MNLNKTTIDSLPLPVKGYVLHWDDNLKGFGLRVTSSGVRSFIVQQRIKDKDRRITIGRYGVFTAEQARKEARKLIGDIARGGDPVTEKAQKKLEAKPLREAFEDYIERRPLKPLTIYDIRRCMSQVYPDWLDKPMTKITVDMISTRHRSHGAEHSPARANLAMRYLRAIFNFAMDNYTGVDGLPLIADNVVRRAMKKAWHRVDRRQTVIRPHELGAWVNAVLLLPNSDMRDYFMTLLLTGLRREEALKLQWFDVDPTGKTVIARDPKNSRDHMLPLTDYLLEIMTGRKAVAASDYVFAGSDGRRISNFRYSLAAIEKTCAVRATPHDLRRTFATIAESLDIPAYALKRLLNHADGADVTAGYIIANVERLREPMQKITDYVLKSAGIKPGARVVDIRRAS